MKHLQTFESYSKEEISKDNDYYNIFLKMNNEDLEKMRKEYLQLKRKAISNCNADLRDKGHEGSIGASDAADCELEVYLNGDDKEKFMEYSRILDFKVGFKPKK